MNKYNPLIPFAKNIDILWDIYHTYKGSQITYGEYFAANPNYEKRCQEMIEEGLLNGFDDYVEILEPYATSIERIAENRTTYGSSNLVAMYEEMTNIEKYWTLSISSTSPEEDRGKLEHEAGRLIRRAYSEADRTAKSLENERKDAVFKNSSYKEKLLRLENVIKKAEIINEYLDQISEFINKPIFCIHPSGYIIQTKYYFRQNLSGVVSLLQNSISSAAEKIKLYEKQEAEIIYFRNLIRELHENPDNTNIDKVSDELYFMDVTDRKNNIFFFPEYLLDPENPSIISAVVKGGMLKNDSTKNTIPHKIVRSTSKPPKLDIPPNFETEENLNAFRLTGGDSLFDFVFENEKLKSHPLNLVFTIYMNFIKSYIKYLIPTGQQRTINIGQKQFVICDFAYKKNNKKNGIEN